jgi:class 3 adenylate cyclase
MSPPWSQRPALSAADEQRYRAFRSSQVAPFERLAAILGAGSVLLFALWDLEVSSEALEDTLRIRVGLAVLLVGLFGLTFSPVARRHGLLQVVSTVTIVGGFSWVLTELPDGFLIGLAGLTLSAALLPLIALNLRAMVGLCAVAVAIPNLFLLGTDASRFTFINLNVWMGLASVLGISFWFVFDVVNRRLFIAEQEVIDQRERADRLVANMLPGEIAERLKTSDATVADRFESVSVLFADIVGFTAFASAHEPDVVVDLLNQLFSRFDDLVDVNRLEKIKTLGDGYMAAGGVPIATDDHAKAVANLALDMVRATAEFSKDHGIDWSIRVGIHTGSVVAGVIGKQKYAYDLWGDAVNVASRLESTGVPGRIQVSGPTALLLPAAYQLERRGTITLKNRGSATTYFLSGRVSPPATDVPEPDLSVTAEASPSTAPERVAIPKPR